MLLSFAVTLVAAAAPQTPSYAYEVLPTPLAAGNTVTIGLGLNASGQVAGYGFASGWSFALAWTDPGTVHELSASFGWQAAEAYAIDDRGFVAGAGAVDATATKLKAFVAHPLAGTYAPRLLQPLVDHPSIGSFASAIAANGLVAGASDTVPVTPPMGGNPQTRAVLWKSGAPRDLGTLGGDVSWATGLNSSATVVGVSNSSPGTLVHAFRWTPQVGMERLAGFDPSSRTWAVDVNEAGWIAGDADTGDERHAVVWTQVHHFVVLPHLPGDLWSESAALNDRGVVVGRGRTTVDILARVWIHGAPYDLDALVGDPGLKVYGALDVNDAGQILCQAFDLTTDPWRTVPVLLTPEP